MNTLVLNDEFKHIENNSKTIINNDKEETVEANSILTVNKDYTQNIKENQINTVEKEKLTTVKEDYEIHVLKDLNTIVKNDIKTIVENNVITSIKNILLKYVEKDASDKYLENLFIQVANELGLDIKDSFHLDTTNALYEGSNEITLEANSGISLRCGGNVATVDSSGIFFHTPNYVKNSPNNGVDGIDVIKPLIKKPLYEKIRVISLDATVTKQNTIDEVLTFTATVEKYENDAWSQTTDLNETQLAQLQWYFIKNNDESDTDIITDNPTNDNITINGLTMTVNVQEDNIYKWGHAHCYVVNSEKEGYAKSELKRYLEVKNIISSHSSQEEGQCIAILNVENPRNEELAQIRWHIEDTLRENYNGKEIITHNLKEEKVHEINFFAYIEGKTQDGANDRLTHNEKGKYISSLGFEDDN